MHGMRKLLASLGLAILIASPAVAQPITPADDKLLWCASAFYWLAGSAQDAGDTEESAMYDRWSETLLQFASASLVQSGVPPERIEQLISAYDEATLEQLGRPDAPHDVGSCPDLLVPPWQADEARKADAASGNNAPATPAPGN
jgi:hypothetical protein